MKGENRGSMNPAMAAALSASVAAELHHARLISRRLSLCSKNMSVLSGRIGHQAAGLSELARYFDHFAGEVENRSLSMAGYARDEGHLAVDRWRHEKLLAKLNKAGKVSDSPSSQNEIARCIAHCQAVTVGSVGGDCEAFCREILSLLDDMERPLKTVRVIAVSCRVEAVDAGHYRREVLDLTSSLEHLAETLSSRLKKARDLIFGSRHGSVVALEGE